LGLLHIIGKSAEGDGIRLGYRFPLCLAIRERTRNLWNFRYPAAVGLSFDFNVEPQVLAPGAAGRFLLSAHSYRMPESRAPCT